MAALGNHCFHKLLNTENVLSFQEFQFFQVTLVRPIFSLLFVSNQNNPNLNVNQTNGCDETNQL